MTDILNILFLIWLLVSALFIGLWWFRRRELDTTDQATDQIETADTATDPSPIDDSDIGDPDIDDPHIDGPTADTDSGADTNDAPDDGAQVTADLPAEDITEFTGEESTDTTSGEVLSEDDADPTNAAAGDQEVAATADTPIDTENDSSDEQVEDGFLYHQTSIEDMLDGIVLPYELVPVTANVKDFDRHRIFISNHPDAVEVGTAFADELTRLGYTVEPAGFDEALATRGEDSLSMRMVPSAASATEGGLPVYPAAREDDVALEVWVGRGRPPR